jgi:hypothetical protein
MKILLIILSVSIGLSTNAKELSASPNSDTTLIVKKFKWKITLPEGFKPVEAASIEPARQRGKKLVEKSTDVQIKDNASVIFKFVDGLNLVEAVQQPLDLKNRSYLSVKKEVQDLMYKTFAAQLSNVRIDSSSGTEMVDGMKFTVLHFRIYRKEQPLFTSYLYSRMFGGIEFGVNILYDKPEAGNNLLSAFRRSSFHN